jgi:hypothetical protein
MNVFWAPRVVCVCIYVGRVTRLGEFSPLHWAIVYFGQCFENYRSYVNFLAIFLRGISCMYIYFDKSLFGPHFGRLFHKLIWSPCFFEDKSFGALILVALCRCQMAENHASRILSQNASYQRRQSPFTDGFRSNFSFAVIFWREKLHMPCWLTEEPYSINTVR